MQAIFRWSPNSSGNQTMKPLACGLSGATVRLTATSKRPSESPNGSCGHFADHGHDCGIAAPQSSLAAARLDLRSCADLGIFNGLIAGLSTAMHGSTTVSNTFGPKGWPRRKLFRPSQPSAFILTTSTTTSALRPEPYKDKTVRIATYMARVSKSTFAVRCTRCRSVRPRCKSGHLGHCVIVRTPSPLLSICFNSTRAARQLTRCQHSSDKCKT